MRAKYTALLVLAVSCGGLAITVSKEVFSVVPPVFLLAIRFFLAFAVLRIVMFKHISKNSHRGDFFPSLVTGLSLAVGFVFYNLGLANTTATNVGFFFSLSTVFVPFLGLAINKTKIKKEILIGCGITLAGLYLLATDGASLSLNKGDILIVICAVFFALQIVLNARYLDKVDPIVMVKNQLLIVSITCLVVSICLGEDLTTIATFSPKIWLEILFIAVLGTAFLYLTQCYVQKILPATVVGVSNALTPVVTTVSAFFVLGESIGLIAAIGGLLVLIGCIYVGMQET